MGSQIYVGWPYSGMDTPFIESFSSYSRAKSTLVIAAKLLGRSRGFWGVIGGEEDDHPEPMTSR